MGEEVKR